MRVRLAAKPTPPTPAAPPARLPADRVSEGRYVRLLWHPDDDSMSVAVDDRRTGEHCEGSASGEQALFAFNHPFAFAG